MILRKCQLLTSNFRKFDKCIFNKTCEVFDNNKKRKKKKKREKNLKILIIGI